MGTVGQLETPYEVATTEQLEIPNVLLRKSEQLIARALAIVEALWSLRCEQDRIEAAVTVLADAPDDDGRVRAWRDHTGLSELTRLLTAIEQLAAGRRGPFTAEELRVLVFGAADGR